MWMRYYPGFVYRQATEPTGGGAGGGTGTTPPAAGGTTPNTGSGGGTGDAGQGNNAGGNGNGGSGGNVPAAGAGTTPAAATPASGATPPADEKKFSQADVDRIIQNRLTEEQQRQQRKNDEEQGKFKDLYEKEQQAHAATKTQLESSNKHVERMHGGIDGEIKEWPAEVKSMDPGKDDLEKRMTWLENGRKLVTALKSGRVPPNGNHGAGGNRAGGGNGVDAASVTTNYLDKTYPVPGQSSDKK